MEKHSEDKGLQRVRDRVGAGYFGIIPFAVFAAYEGFYREGILSFLLALPLSYIVCFIIYTLFSDAFYHFNYEKRSAEEEGKPLSWITVLLEAAAAVGISCIAIVLLASKM